MELDVAADEAWQRAGLPDASGDAFVVFDSEVASAWLTMGAARTYHRSAGRVLAMPEDAESRCVLEGQFTRALYVYLDREALWMSVPDALWLVDYGFRMPGVVCGVAPGRKTFQRPSSRSCGQNEWP